MSIFERQQERHRNERYFGPWEATVKAIRAAHGAREGVSIAGFAADALQRTVDIQLEACRQKNDADMLEMHPMTVVDALWLESHRDEEEARC
jgi:hypothetical protein